MMVVMVVGVMVMMKMIIVSNVGGPLDTTSICALKFHPSYVSLSDMRLISTPSTHVLKKDMDTCDYSER